MAIIPDVYPLLLFRSLVRIALHQHHLWPASNMHLQSILTYRRVLNTHRRMPHIHQSRPAIRLHRFKTLQCTSLSDRVLVVPRRIDQALRPGWGHTALPISMDKVRVRSREVRNQGLEGFRIHRQSPSRRAVVCIKQS